MSDRFWILFVRGILKAIFGSLFEALYPDEERRRRAIVKVQWFFAIVAVGAIAYVVIYIKNSGIDSRNLALEQAHYSAAPPPQPAAPAAANAVPAPLQPAPASKVTAPAALAPDKNLDAQLAPADLLIEEAGKAWEKGNQAQALALAEKAKRMYSNLVPPDHPKMTRVDGMIDAARGLLKK